MSFKESYQEYQKAHQEYMKKVKLWFITHECGSTCPLYKYHSIDKTSLNSAACEYIAEKYVNEVSDIIENWYEDYQFANRPKSRFYTWLGISSTSELPWQNFDSECDNCSSKLPCYDCEWWEEGLVE